MNAHQTIEKNNKIMTSPVGEPLQLTLFKSREGLEEVGVTTYEGVMTFKELASHFVVEENSNLVDEKVKKQRDVDTRRVNGLKKYWEQSRGPVFPNMTLFCSNIEVNECHEIGNQTVAVAAIPPEADRFICDGQGRTTFIKWLLEQNDSEAFADHTVAFKLIVTDTKDLSDEWSSRVIKQVFADYHVGLVKPNKSISKHFDTGNPFSHLMNELLNVDVGGGLVNRIALHGNIRKGHVWTFQQFSSMIQKFLDLTPAQANKQLQDKERYDQALQLCTDFLVQAFSLLPVSKLDCDEFKNVHDQSIFTKAIFANALGYVGRSLLDEMLLDEAKGWDSLSGITMPILDKSDKFWQRNNVTMNDMGAIKIIKGTDKRIGSLICRELRIFPCADLSA